MAVGPELRAMLDQLEGECSSRLSPVERLLLSTDGTVTHAVEALTKTYIDVRPIARKTDDGTLHRDAALTREDNGDQMVYARSKINLDHVDDAVADELVRGEKGIGDLLRDRGAETHRRIHEMNARKASDEEMPAFVGTFSAEYLERRYTVHSDDEELMEITEWFPRSKY